MFKISRIVYSFRFCSETELQGSMSKVSTRSIVRFSSSSTIFFRFIHKLNLNLIANLDYLLKIHILYKYVLYMVYSIKVYSKNTFKISVGFFFLFVQINQILLTFLLILLGFGGADMLILLYLISASHAKLC